MNSGNGNKKQALPKQNLHRAERLAAELRANLKKRKSAARSREQGPKTTPTDDAGSGE